MAGTEAYKAVVAAKVAALSEADKYSGTRTNGVVRTNTGGKATTASSNDNPASSNADEEDSNPAISYSTIVYFFDTFYNRLFEVAPGVRPLFKNSIKVQGRALVKMVGTAVTALENLPVLVPTLEQLAIRHIAYGAKCEHYAVVGEVLLYALETCLGKDNWTPEVANAWLTVYSVMMSVMIPATQKAEAEAQKQASNTGCSGRSTASASSASTSDKPTTPSSPAAVHPLSEEAANSPVPETKPATPAPNSALAKMEPIPEPVAEVSSTSIEETSSPVDVPADIAAAASEVVEGGNPVSIPETAPVTESAPAAEPTPAEAPATESTA